MTRPIPRNRLCAGLVSAAALILALGLGAAGADEGSSEPDGSDGSGDELLDLNAMAEYDPGDQAPAFTGISALFSGRALTKLAQDVKREDDLEALFSDLTLASAKISVTLNPSVAVTVEGLFTYEVQTNGDETRTDYEFALWEGNGRFKLGPVDLTVGQQHVAWGICDGINPTDIINPRDYDRILDAELGITKLPALMARTEWYLPDSMKLDAVVLPFFVPARYTIVGRDVALFGHEFPLSDLLDELRENPDFKSLEKMLDLLYPGWEEDIQSELDNESYYNARTEHLDDDFTNMEGAIRLSGHARSIDFSVSYFYLWDDLPTLHVNPDLRDLLDSLGGAPERRLPTLNVYGSDIDAANEPFTMLYHRSPAVGADFGTTLGGIGLRAEGLYKVSQYAYTEDLDTRRMPQVSWAVNADYLFSNNLLISGSFYQSAYIGETSGLLMPPSYDLILLLLRKSWLDDRLTMETAAIYDFSYMTGEKWQEGDLLGEDGMLTPMLTYAITDPFKVTVGANLISSSDDFHLLGILRDNSRVFATVRYDF